METIKVKINPDSKTAREVNPLGDEPSPYFAVKKHNWQEAESKLREFEIEFEFMGWIPPENLEPNTIHTAEVISETKIRIV